MKQESVFKGKVMALLKLESKLVAIRHEDVRTCGIPDLSTTLYGRTCWWEFKHCTPKFESTGIQELTCLRLAAAGFCRYIIYWEQGETKRTLIVHPKNLHELTPEASCVGFSHDFVVNEILKRHQP